MKWKLAMLMLTVALSSTAASANDHARHHYRNAYNAMNVTQGRAYPGYIRPSTATEDPSLSGTGPSTFGGSGESGGASGGGP